MTETPPSSKRHSAPSAVAPLRVLTYNINWEVDPARGIDAILAADADIVCLQETNRKLQGRFEAALGSRYPFATFLHSETRTGGGSAFFSKHVGQEAAHVRSATGWFDARALCFATPIGPVRVLNVHLKPPICDRRERFAFGAWLRAGGERRAEIERFCAPLHGDGDGSAHATVIAGDFNEQERGRAVRYVEANGYRNALRPFDRRTPTWEQRIGPLTLRRRMDHIFHCGQLRCVDARVIVAGDSDHYPVVADLVRV